MAGSTQSRVKGGVAWRIGTRDDVAWINENIAGHTAITSAIPPKFDDYATLLLPGKLGVPRDHRGSMVGLWCGSGPGQ